MSHLLELHSPRIKQLHHIYHVTSTLQWQINVFLRWGVNHGCLAVISVHTCRTATITWIGLPWRSSLFYVWAAMKTWGWDILLKQIHLFSPINCCTATSLKKTFMNCVHDLCDTSSLPTVEEGGLDTFALLSLKPPPHRTSKQALPSLSAVLGQHTKRSQHEAA